MIKCKVLWINKKPAIVEEKINDWLAEHPGIKKIHAMTQQPNFCYSILYEE